MLDIIPFLFRIKSIIGLTAIGRATVETLKTNNVFIVPARRHWVEAGWHPPQAEPPEDVREETGRDAV